MSLDDRILREHFDRRAHAGAIDPTAIAAAVAARLDKAQGNPWWRGVRLGLPSLGLAAAAIVVALIGIGVLPGHLAQGPGASPTDTAWASNVDGASYPTERAMTPAELASFMSGDPSGRIGTIVVADVQVGYVRGRVCGPDETCPGLWIALPNGGSLVAWGGPTDTLSQAPYAFRVREDGGLDFLGAVRPGPTGLAWTLPQLLASEPYFRSSAVPDSTLYVLDATLTVPDINIYCPLAVWPAPKFSCTDIAWFVANDAPVPTGTIEAPPDSLRASGVDGAGAGPGQWLIHPALTPDGCFACPPAGAVDIGGPVRTFADLGLDPGQSANPSVGPTTTPALDTSQAMSATELASLLGTNPADRAGTFVVADVELETGLYSCVLASACPDSLIGIGPGKWIQVFGKTGSASPGPYAFEVRPDGHLALLGAVHEGPQGLAWSMLELIRGLPGIRSSGAPDHELVVLDASVVAIADARGCLVTQPRPTPPTYGWACGETRTWLAPNGDPGLWTGDGPPPTWLRIQNLTPSSIIPKPIATIAPGDGPFRGLWLIDPAVTVDGCNGCSTAGAAYLLGPVVASP